MITNASPISYLGLALGILSHCTGVPMLSSAASMVGAPSHAKVHQLARVAVRDFMQAAPSLHEMVAKAGADLPWSGRTAAINVAYVQPTAPSQPAESGDTQATSLPAVTNQEVTLFALINQERAQHGEAALTYDLSLAKIARGHSQDMSDRGYFDHYAPAPAPQTPMDRYIAAVPNHPDYAVVGENIFYRSSTDSITDYAAQSNDAFMHSPGHRANILMAEYSKVGVGIYRNANTGEYWVTEMFLRDRQ